MGRYRDKMEDILWELKGKAFSLLLYLFRIFPVQKDKVLIVNYYGAGFGDNGKYIAQELHKRNSALNIYWISNQESGFPDYIHVISRHSLKSFYHLATAAVWIDNCRKAKCIIKRKKQYYMQTWHGSIALKRIEKDAEAHLEKKYVKSAIHDSRMADVMLSNGTFCTEMYRRAFWYDGEILECGSPRADILFYITDKQKLEIKEKLGILKSKRIILYAPTFRADGNLNCYGLDFQKILDVLQQRTGEKWVFAVRLHPNIASKANLIQYNEDIVNATSYPDMYELLAATDILVTDYSSSMFEAGFVRKPVFLFATDIDSYTKDRNFYFDLPNLPYPLSKTNGELLHQLESFNKIEYGQNLAAFYESLGLKESGNASALAVQKILEVLGKID